MSANFSYYSLKFKLMRPMLGTATETSIYHLHIIEKAKKLIAEAQKAGNKIKKSLEKYKGTEISPEKEMAELKGALRASLSLLGKDLNVPDTIDGILDHAKSVETELAEKTKNLELFRATTFLKNEKGYPILSSHMVLGNIKENLKILVNNGGKDLPTQYKSQVSEMLALDIKAVEPFMVPDKDILRASNEDEVQALGTPTGGRWLYEPNTKTRRVLLERPLRGKTPQGETISIALSEVLPEGTEFGCTLRVRSDSPMSEDILKRLLDFGKSNGLGCWRGSGNMGAYVFKLDKLEDFKEFVPEGWN